MGANPEPNYALVLLKPDCTPTFAYSYRINRFSPPDTFKIQTGVMGIFLPKPVILESKLFNFLWQLLRALNESA
jgi:hypothetical protein